MCCSNPCRENLYRGRETQISCGSQGKQGRSGVWRDRESTLLFCGQTKETRRDTSKAFGKSPPPLDPSLHIVILADCWLWWTYAGTGRELTWWDGQGDKFGKSAPTWDEQGGVRITPPQHVQLLPLLLCWVHLVQNPDVNRNVELVPLIPSCVE